MKNNKNMKVFFLQEIIPNYRLLVFQRLSNLNNIDLTVFYIEHKKKINSGLNYEKINIFNEYSCAL